MSVAKAGDVILMSANTFAAFSGDAGRNFTVFYPYGNLPANETVCTVMLKIASRTTWLNAAAGRWFRRWRCRQLKVSTIHWIRRSRGPATNPATADAATLTNGEAGMACELRSAHLAPLGKREVVTILDNCDITK